MRVDIDARTLLARLGAAGALLTCLAIVLNAGNFGKAGKHESAGAKTEQTVSVIPVAPLEIAEVRQPERYESLVQAADNSASMRQLVEPVSSPDLRGAPASMPTHAVVEGVWAPGTACSLHNFREGFLPTVINADGAWAGETFCIFKNKRQIDTGWTLTASCSNAREQWTTRVRLTIVGDRLIWASKRGTQAYSRCAPDFLIAEAR
jgi:hypothetical protein